MNKLLKARLQNNKRSAEDQLESGLRFLAQTIENARKDLAEGRPLDAHLIHNANALTQSIMQYNLSVELLPYVEEES